MILICSSRQIYYVTMQQTILDKTVSSLCPVCLKIVSARIFSEDGKVFMEKKCHEHEILRNSAGPTFVCMKNSINMCAKGRAWTVHPKPYRAVHMTAAYA